MVALALSVSALVLEARNAAALDRAIDLYLADLWVSIVVPPVGAFLVARGRGVLLGWLLLSTASLSLGAFAGTYATFDAAVRGGALPLGGVAAWVANWAWTPYLLLLSVVPMLFPDGRPRSRPWAFVVGGVASAIAAVTILEALEPGPVEAFPDVENPIGLDGIEWLGQVSSALTMAVVLIGAPAGLISVVLRWRAAGSDARARIRWFFVALAVLVVTVVTADRLSYPWSDVSPALGFTVVLVALAAAVHSERVASDVQRSREELAVARESERLRLHRDLHDGLGPELAGVALKLSALGERAEDSAFRDDLADAAERMRETVAEVRRIVADLRPPALDELGLVGAVKEKVAALGRAAGIDVRVLATGVWDPPLVPAVEVAAYRIAVEGVTNAVRHAGGTSCTVRLRREGDALHVEIADDGAGLALGRTPGVGLDSMRARAEELGGRFGISERVPGGVVVRAELPLGGLGFSS